MLARMNNIYISSHKLKDHAGFKGDHLMQLQSPAVNLILGINGSGKSSLLNSLYGNIMVSISPIVAIHLAGIDISKSTVHNGMTLSESYSVFEVNDPNQQKNYEVGARMNLNGQFNQVGKELRVFKKLLLERFKNSDQSLPVFRYFQSEKLIVNKQSIVAGRSFNQIENRSVGYNQHFSTNLSIQQATSFFINQVINENLEKVEKEDFDYESIKGKYIRETLSTFSQILYGEELKISIKPSRFSNGQSLVIEKGNEELEFAQLSSGEKYVISLVLELIWRNTTINPNSTDYTKTPGIVLIDEIEDHLHPRWQLTILEALQSSFPSFQFIVSSHSPLMASSVRREQIIALSNFEIIPSEELPDIYSGTSDELLNKILFSDIQINKFKEERRELDLLISKFDFTGAELLLSRLKERLQSNPKWIIDYERKISFGKR